MISLWQVETLGDVTDFSSNFGVFFFQDLKQGTVYLGNFHFLSMLQEAQEGQQGDPGKDLDFFITKP